VFNSFLVLCFLHREYTHSSVSLVFLLGVVCVLLPKYPHECPMVWDWIVQTVNGVLKCGPPIVHLA
jgi:membrane-bound metal-dependent hydrolase YbcI (DUF457 family)